MGEGRERLVDGRSLHVPGGGLYHATKHALEALPGRDAVRAEGLRGRVIVIEPGTIETGFGGATVRGLDAATGDGGPYADFNAAVGKSTRDVYEKGLSARRGGPPEAVAEVIEKAISARRRKARYAVTPSARLLMSLRAALPDSGWDAMLRTSFPHPGGR